MNKYKKFGALAASVGLLSLAGAAVAQEIQPPEEMSTSTPQDAAPVIAEPSTQFPAPMVIDIDGSGTALVRGVVQQAGSDSVTIMSWGGTWTVRVAPEGTVVPAGAGGTTDLSAISAGDFVGAEGRVAADQSATIEATFVRDWTTNPYTGAEAPAATAPTQLPTTAPEPLMEPEISPAPSDNLIESTTTPDATF